MSGGQNNSRLVSMTYPDGRVVDYVYNSGIDSDIGRLSAIADDDSGSPGTVLESYQYLGLGTIAGDTNRGANDDVARLLSEVPHIFIRIFSALGFRVQCISCVPDGRFPDRPSDCRPAGSARAGG